VQIGTGRVAPDLVPAPDSLPEATRRSPGTRSSPTGAVVERVSAYVSPDPDVDRALGDAHRRASRGDTSWAEWLQDLRAGRAIVALLEVEITLTVDGAKRRLTTEMPAVWLELHPHPPLVERQVQDATAISLSALGNAIAVPQAELGSMSVHVVLDRAIRDRLPAPATPAGP
jgi:hypothetical protein